MGFSRQENWIGLPFPIPGHLPNPGIEPVSLAPPALGGGFFTTLATREAQPSPVSPSNYCTSLLIRLLPSESCLATDKFSKIKLGKDMYQEKSENNLGGSRWGKDLKGSGQVSKASSLKPPSQWPPLTQVLASCLILSPQDCLLRKSNCSFSQRTFGSGAWWGRCLLRREEEKQQEGDIPPGEDGAVERNMPVEGEEKRAGIRHKHLQMNLGADPPIPLVHRGENQGASCEVGHVASRAGPSAPTPSQGPHALLGAVHYLPRHLPTVLLPGERPHMNDHRDLSGTQSWFAHSQSWGNPRH